MRLGKEIPVWEAFKTIHEGGKVGVKGRLTTFVLSYSNGEYYNNGELITSLGSNWTYYKLEESKIYADEDTTFHYYISFDGQVKPSASKPTQHDIAFGNAFEDRDYAQWLAEWTRLIYGMRKFATENNGDFIKTGNHYTGYVLGYKQNTGEVYIIQTKEVADLQTVCFSGLGVAGKALDKYGHEYKRLVSTAPYNKLFK